MDEDIYSFHNNLVDTLNPYRKWLIKDKYKNPEINLWDKEKENIKLYWYPFVKDLFVPHITVFKATNKSDVDKIIPLIGWNKKVCIDKIRVASSSVCESWEKSSELFSFGLGS